MRYFSFCLLAAFLLAACKDECYYAQEPELKLVLDPGTRFRRVYSPDGRDVPVRNGRPVLPVSLHADSVTYLFDGETRTDTLTIFYTRRFFFESEKCGMVVEVTGQGLRQDVRTTFTNASVVFTSDEWGLGPNRRNIYEVRITP
ncbi:MAG: hypothetical protein AVDCRST_MAG56-570 [uncultured Cytophagales bacterium]|uniref:Lipoprotein n=1 Tax=uncultured Cytophagales bacterium TaxID=158755 RepID=A0A6J4HIC9_9SPHI|nr:MAG: hypothetical protein AVDCRST_MAG56-570 [uncultured Cytophagales bacterium]